MKPFEPLGPWIEALGLSPLVVENEPVIHIVVVCMVSALQYIVYDCGTVGGE